MKKSTKGAIAALGAAALLLGGAGSLAFWNANATVAGGTINAGELMLVEAVPGECAAASWKLDVGEDLEGVALAPTGTVVPGDTLTKTCSFTIEAVGDHLRAEVTATGGTSTGALAVTPTASFTISDNTVTEITEANHGQTLTAVLEVLVNEANGNGTMQAEAVLSDYVVTLQQVHN